MSLGRPGKYSLVYYCVIVVVCKQKSLNAFCSPHRANTVVNAERKTDTANESFHRTNERTGLVGLMVAFNIFFHCIRALSSSCIFYSLAFLMAFQGLWIYLILSLRFLRSNCIFSVIIFIFFALENLLSLFPTDIHRNCVHVMSELKLVSWSHTTSSFY